jgi:stress response protein YsnF
VKEREEVVEEPLLREEVVVEHVPINRLWEVGSVPEARYEGDTLILPVLEEVVVVEKRLMLKEELHIRRIQKTVQEPQHIMLRSEEVTVERIEPTQASGEIPRA